jgi:hypothetical protein
MLYVYFRVARRLDYPDIPQIDQSLFRVHEFKLREFEDLRNTLQDAQKDGEGRKTIYLTTSSDDFRRMLAVLYSS